MLSACHAGDPDCDMLRAEGKLPFTFEVKSPWFFFFFFLSFFIPLCPLSLFTCFWQNQISFVLRLHAFFPRPSCVVGPLLSPCIPFDIYLTPPIPGQTSFLRLLKESYRISRCWNRFRFFSFRLRRHLVHKKRDIFQNINPYNGLNDTASILYPLRVSENLVMPFRGMNASLSIMCAKDSI